MGEKKGLSQTPLWALSEEEMAAAGWTGTQGEDLNGQPAERSSVLQEGFGVLPSVWDPMRDDMPAETASGGKEKPARRFSAGRISPPVFPMTHSVITAHQPVFQSVFLCKMHS